MGKGGEPFHQGGRCVHRLCAQSNWIQHKYDQPFMRWRSGGGKGLLCWYGRRQPPVLCPPLWPPFLGRHRVLGQRVWSRNCSKVQQIILSFKTLKPFQPSVSSHG